MLAPIVARFLAQYPEISREIAADSALTDIVAGRFDAGIRIGERLERDMIAVRVSDELKQVVVASPSYIARRGRPETPQALAGHNCIRIRLPSGAFFSWRLQSKGKAIEVAVDGTLMVNDTGLALRAACDGVGLLQVPLDYAAPLLADGRLVAVLEGWAAAPVAGFFLYYSSRRQLRAPLQALVDFLRNAVKTAAPRRR